MKYLVINHVPFGQGTQEGTYTLGSLWLQDIQAMANAMQEAGIALCMAAPLREELHVAQSGSFDLVEVTPTFTYFPLPVYLSFKEYLRVRKTLRAQLQAAIAQADVVQIDYGGHPISLGWIAWDLIQAARKPCIWLFDGADPFPRLELWVNEEKSWLSRRLKAFYVQQFMRFCRHAIAQADVVITHNLSIPERFQAVWGAHCHTLLRSFVRPDLILKAAQWEEKQRQLTDSSRPLRLAVAGRQIMMKGTDHVLMAMAKAIQQGYQLELDVIGEGEDLLYFKQLAHELGITEKVTFHGTIPYGFALFDQWALCDVMVITNLTAEISRNVLLGAARGLPLIMYHNVGIDKLIEEYQSGILITCGDIDALAATFMSVARDRAQLVAVGERGLQMATAHTLEASHRRRVGLIRSLLTGKN